MNRDVSFSWRLTGQHSYPTSILPADPPWFPETSVSSRFLGFFIKLPYHFYPLAPILDPPHIPAPSRLTRRIVFFVFLLPAIASLLDITIMACGLTAKPMLTYSFAISHILSLMLSTFQLLRLAPCEASVVVESMP